MTVVDRNYYAIADIKIRPYFYPRVWERTPLSYTDGSWLIEKNDDPTLARRIRARIRAFGKDPITAKIVREGGVSVL